MKVIINSKEYEYKKNTSLEEIAKDFEGEFILARVNNRLRELTYKLSFDANVEFLDLSSNDSMRAYQSTLRYIIAMATKRVLPNENIKFSNSISMSIYGKIIGKNMTQEMLDKINNEVINIINSNYTLERKTYDIEEMKEYYSKIGYYDKLGNLEYRKEKVNVYECDGYRDYVYSYMCPSTGYVKEYNLILYYPGFILQFPRSETKGEIPGFSDEPNFLTTLAKANKWSADTHSENIYEINDKCSSEEELIKFINICETRHNHQLQEIGDKIESNLDYIRLIAIAGPSSSGKTTFSKRLEIELLSRNIHPLRISLDNYYLTAEEAPKDEFGNPDFEHIESLNLKLFSQNMQDFLSGKEVSLPVFDFTTKKTSFMPPIKLEKDGVIMIEGIHALNEKLTKAIPKSHKFKIYIVPLAQRNIDNHTPIGLTELRLVRRIVRDKNFRDTSALKTLKNWPSVRRGEYTWIYPHMENADYIFNSELGYELLALKKYAISSLKEIDELDPHYIEANGLLKFLKLFRSIDDKYIPNNSLVREFIGGSVFKD